MNESTALVTLTGILALSACVKPLAESDLPCPCESGWTCCPGANLCVSTPTACAGNELGSVDAGMGVEASVDASVAEGMAAEGAPLSSDASIGPAGTEAGGCVLSWKIFTQFRTNPYPLRVAAGDLNGDGKADLAVADSSGIGVLLGNGDGTFLSQATYGSPLVPSWVAISDLNGDGKPDLVAASGEGVSVLLGNGDGTFQMPTIVESNPAWSVTIGDLNGDHIPDVVAGSNGATVLLGNGDGTFRSRTSVGLAGGMGGFDVVAIGDLDNDGKADVVVVSQSGDGLNVFLGNGDGTLKNGRPFSTGIGSGPIGVAMWDLNRDGKLDVAVANGSDDSAGVLLGNGDGTLQAPVEYQTGSDPNTVQIADFDGDGNGDLAVANGNSDSVGILLGHGDGTFEAQIVVGTGAGSTPNGLATADMNDDGHPDLATAAFGLSSVSVIMNVCGGSGRNSGGSSSGGSSSSGSAAGCDVPALFAADCALAGCHAALGSGGGLDLSLGNLGNLAAIMSNDYPGQLIVDPGNPMMSALYEELMPAAVGTAGQMPPGFSLLPADVECVAAWITTYPPPMR